MLQVAEDLLVLGECSGHVQIFKVSTGEILASLRTLIHATISTVIRTKSNENEYGFSTYSGVCFTEFNQELTTIVKEDPVKYVDSKTVVGLFEYKKDQFIAVHCNSKDYIWSFDRSSMQNIVKINNPYDSSTALQLIKLPFYSYKHLPFLVIRD
jgi:hypothetical protein